MAEPIKYCTTHKDGNVVGASCSKRWEYNASIRWEYIKTGECVIVEMVDKTEYDDLKADRDDLRLAYDELFQEFANRTLPKGTKR